MKAAEVKDGGQWQKARLGQAVGPAVETVTAVFALVVKRRSWGNKGVTASKTVVNFSIFKSLTEIVTGAFGISSELL